MARKFTIITILVGLALMLALGCGRKGKSNEEQQSAVDHLTLSTWSIQEGDELKVNVVWTGAEDLYQLSCRVAFDPQGWQPVSVKDGGAFDEDALFFADTSQAGFVPLAVTPLMKGPGVKGDGTLGVITFKKKTEGAAEPALVADSSYLKARDSAKGEIEIAVGGAQ